MKHLFILFLLITQNLAFAEFDTKAATKPSYKFDSRDNLQITLIGLGAVSLGVGTASNIVDKIDYETPAIFWALGFVTSLMGVLESGTQQNLYEYKFYTDYRRIKLLVRSGHKLNMVLNESLLVRFLMEAELSYNTEIEMVHFFNSLFEKITARARFDVGKMYFKKKHEVALKANEILSSDDLYMFLIELLDDQLNERTLDIAYSMYMVEFYDAFKQRYRK